MAAYYNEFDPYAAAWLENLIAAGVLPAGDVDRRSIVEVKANELKGYTQCHFFAGIGGWPYALRLAGWPDDKQVWTGSCPCQPLSSAGQRKGHADERHLWPAFCDLIAECRPPVCFGEQVASKDGREWFAGVRADLEGMGYACGAADLCAASSGAPHIRQRLFWLADDQCKRPDATKPTTGTSERIHGSTIATDEIGGIRVADSDSEFGRSDGEKSNTETNGRRHARRCGETERPTFCEWFSVCHDPNRCDNPNQCWLTEQGRDAPAGFVWTDHDGWLAQSEGKQFDRCRKAGHGRGQPSNCGANGRLGNASSQGLPQRGSNGRVQPETMGPQQGQTFISASDFIGVGNASLSKSARQQQQQVNISGQANWRHTSAWSDFDIIRCADGKARRTQSGVFPLADGLPESLDGLGAIPRVGTLKGTGNAIVPQVAAEFIQAYCEIT